VNDVDYRGTLADERVRAAHIGARVIVGADDRPASVDPRGSLACPTCEDGVRTIVYPVRCRDCVLGGL
jgi:hypothetical protein